MAEVSGENQLLAAADEEQLLSRHRQEVKQLRAQIQSLKKSIPKGDKKKKKEVGAEIVRLEQDLEERHQQELSQIKQQPTPDPQDGQSVENVESGVERLEVTEGADEVEKSSKSSGKKSRAQKRKDKKAQLDRERELRIVEGEAEATTDNPRLTERQKLTAMFDPLGLTIKDIQPDGHCLYAALSDQLDLRLKTKVTISELRSQCAQYIHTNSSDFMPFLTDPNTGEQLNQEQFDQYCSDIGDTASWGGQLEIRALSHVYKVPINVYQADTPVLCIGEEYPDLDNALRLSYHLHEYGLGEHYNSVVSKS